MTKCSKHCRLSLLVLIQYICLWSLSVHHCLMSLGMEDGRIKDSALSASTIHNDKHAAKLGRVNLVPPSGHSGAWCAKTLNTNQWIQIDLGRPTTVTKVATQGRQDCCSQWVTSYAVSYSLISPYWVYHMNSGQKKVNREVSKRGSAALTCQN